MRLVLNNASVLDMWLVSQVVKKLITSWYLCRSIILSLFNPLHIFTHIYYFWRYFPLLPTHNFISK